MIATVILTATATAALMMALGHKRNSYIHSVEQLSLNRAEEIETLTAELHTANAARMNAEESIGGFITSNAIYRARLKSKLT